MTRVTEHHTLTWTCDRCGGEHRVALRESHSGEVIRVQTHTLNETFTMASMMPEYIEREVVYEITGGLDGNCLYFGGPTGPRIESGSIWDAEVQRRLRAAIEYTVLDPDERAALVVAIQREVRGF
jgi:hypothetical protein